MENLKLEQSSDAKEKDGSVQTRGDPKKHGEVGNVRPAQERPVERVIFGNRVFTENGRAEVDDFSMYNIKECVTASSLSESGGMYIFVGTKGMAKEVTQKFPPEQSRIHLFDLELNLRHTLKFGFGICKKIETSQDGEVTHCIALFNDRIIRRFDFDNCATNMKAVDISGIIDFEINWKYDFILATDGYSIFQIVEDSVVSVFDWGKGLITSMAIRERVPGEKNYVLKKMPTVGKSMSKRKLLSDGEDDVHCTDDLIRGNVRHVPHIFDESSKEKAHDNLSCLEFYALSLDMRMCLFDAHFQEVRTIRFPSGYTTIKYLPRTRIAMVVNTLDDTTRVLERIHDVPKFRATLDHFASCFVESGKNIITGGFDGSVRCIEFRKRGAMSKKIIQLICSDGKASLDVFDKKSSVVDTKPHGYSQRVVGLHFDAHCFFAVYACGVVIRRKL